MHAWHACLLHFHSGESHLLRPRLPLLPLAFWRLPFDEKSRGTMESISRISSLLETGTKPSLSFSCLPLQLHPLPLPSTHTPTHLTTPIPTFANLSDAVQSPPIPPPEADISSSTRPDARSGARCRTAQIDQVFTGGASQKDAR